MSVTQPTLQDSKYLASIKGWLICFEFLSKFSRSIFQKICGQTIGNSRFRKRAAWGSTPCAVVKPEIKKRKQRWVKHFFLQKLVLQARFIWFTCWQTQRNKIETRYSLRLFSLKSNAVYRQAVIMQGAAFVINNSIFGSCACSRKKSLLGQADIAQKTYLYYIKFWRGFHENL